MAAIRSDSTLREYQQFIESVYGSQNAWHFSRRDLLTNIQRFLMRGMKGIRKGDAEKTAKELIVSMGFLLSLMNRLHLDSEDIVWGRFPYLCSYCGSAPCVCKAQKVQTRRTIERDDAERPTTIHDFQRMFETIYPSSQRTLEHAGIHLAEELGETSEAFLVLRGRHTKDDHDKFILEAADMFSCYFGVFNSLNVNLAGQLASYYPEGCHKCQHTPCDCTYEVTMGID